MKDLLTGFVSSFDWFYLPKIRIVDVIEIIILSYLFYQVILWVKKTRAWTLFKGVGVLALFACLAYVFQFNTILWIFKNTINVGIIAVIILFQPELRRALEELGRKKIFSFMIPELLVNDDKKHIKGNRISDDTVQALVGAAMNMSKSKTGALIVIEQDVALGEYETTGIPINAVVSKQLIENIFVHNTPLHDGAVIIRNNTIVAATCYLPLTGRDDLNKDLGTRHRAAVGISEVSDSLTIIVSEETGAISVAKAGMLSRNLDAEMLKKQLNSLNTNKAETKRFAIRKGGKRREKRKKQTAD